MEGKEKGVEGVPSAARLTLRSAFHVPSTVSYRPSPCALRILKGNGDVGVHHFDTGKKMRGGWKSQLHRLMSLHEGGI